MAVDNINQHKSFVQNRRSSLLAAIFLMATSAIGPGFITQTATFTATLGVAFAFGILASILIDFVVQQNIWRVVTLTQMNAAEVANRAIPGSGYLLAVLVIFGGLVFAPGAKGCPALWPSGVEPVFLPYTTLEVIVSTESVASAPRYSAWPASSL